MTNKQAGEILGYWRSIGQEGWFRKNEAIDAAIRERFGRWHQKAANRELEDWRSSPEDCLALVILLDQFSRNMFRASAMAFAQDDYALEIATKAVDAGFDTLCDPAMAYFFHLPFMHSERIADQRRCIRLFHARGGFEAIKFARIHHDVIARFGRFPHRTAVLGRPTTPAEQAFLDSGGFSG
jgi:uncharacterized protein (DUF924 family)